MRCAWYGFECSSDFTRGSSHVVACSMLASLTSPRRPTIHTLTEHCNLLAPGALLGTIVVDGLVTIVVDEHGADCPIGLVWLCGYRAYFRIAYDRLSTLVVYVWSRYFSYSCQSGLFSPCGPPLRSILGRTLALPPLLLQGIPRRRQHLTLLVGRRGGCK